MYLLSSDASIPCDLDLEEESWKLFGAGEELLPHHHTATYRLARQDIIRLSLVVNSLGWLPCRLYLSAAYCSAFCGSDRLSPNRPC
ncbi:hypothetical protein BV22DRAFT_1033093 [Leucogyrophana mollusca]|uniref:Uncharacterized protein n=1 Tax=Leucogyrophana mollusca TaxID=85980 RepID=A0ACB8BKC8_9AGAM|nr:hypothetical protein BV22DRAFT_1033093 [Leucogyrophana mollusca]